MSYVLSRLKERSVQALLAVLYASVPALASEGQVMRSDTGQPVANALVTVLGRPGAAVTDAEGRFTFRPEPVPPFEVLVVAPGGEIMKPVLIESMPEAGPLRIEVAPVANESITVTGTAPDIQSTPAAATTLVSSRDIEVRQPTNLMQMLENVAGVNQVSEGQAAVPAVRGLARGRTLILIDGARVTAERRVGPSATFLDPFSLEDIEVARGPGGVAYGSDAFGGVIAARTRRAEPGSPFQVRALATLGAGVPTRRANVELSKGFEDGGVLFQAHTREADDWRSPEGDVFNSGFSDHGFLVRGEKAVGVGVLSAGWQSDFGRDVERPRTNSRTTRFVYPTEDSHRFTASLDFGQVGGFSRAGASVFLGRYAQVTDQDTFATATRGRSLERADIEARDFHARGFAERFFGQSRLEFGVDVNGRYGLRALDIYRDWNLAGDVTRDLTNVSVDDARRVDTGAYASLDTPVSRVLLASAGVRADRVTTRNRGGYFGDLSTSNGAASGYAALTAGSFDGITVHAQVARGFRDPVLSDRYYRGPTGRGFITGNPDLDPETSLQLDLGVRYTASRLRLGAFYYRYRIDDLIERYETDPDFFFFRNRGRARLQGFEVEAQADLGWRTTVELAAQVARGRALDDNDAYLDDVTPETLTVQVRKQLPRSAFAQIRFATYADDDRPGPGEVAMDGYALLDLSGGLALTRNLELTVLGRNLLDTAYRVSPDRRAVLAPGASVSVTAIVKF
ncbi:MAG: TonB-dependent receptor [Vicinamibacterales bacterium]